MSEYTLDDGRKAERTVNNPDSMTTVTEVYVEPKPQKKLSQRITERLCVCERVVETLDEATGEVVNREVHKLCDDVSVASETRSVQKMVEDKLKKASVGNYVFLGVIAVQVAALVYVLFFM
jgi:hypothetical protein